MADVVLDANAVGQLVTYITPGFLARAGYRTRFPGADRPAGEVLTVSVVASLPLVAIVTALLPGKQTPTQLGYVLLLCAVAFISGYVVALLRRHQRVKGILGKVGYRLEPEQTIWAQTLAEMSDHGEVVVEMKDGRRFRGCPRSGPQHKDDPVNELYIVYPEGEDDDGDWQPFDAAMIVPLGEVSTVTLSEEPTGAPARPAAV